MKSKYKIDDYKGSKIEGWTIIGFSHIDHKNQQYWICSCDCGTEKPVRVNHLMRGHSKGCSKCKISSRALSSSLNWKGGKFISSSFFNPIKTRAVKKGLEFNLTIKYLEELFKKQGGKCFYSDIDLTFPINSRDKNFTSSLDRTDSSKGYLKGNVRFVSKNINVMKMALDETVFINICKLVAKNN